MATTRLIGAGETAAANGGRLAVGLDGGRRERTEARLQGQRHGGAALKTVTVVFRFPVGGDGLRWMAVNGDGGSQQGKAQELKDYKERAIWNHYILKESRSIL
ncbi:putative T-complex protein 1 subunit gamma [Sesbania bispinosa]|nr:putative T-complex protein 1 subunit gamma [Sesbania bispinosa]